MSEKCTTISLPESDWPGLLERSEESVESMLRLAKKHAEYNIKQYQQVLDAKPEDFEIEVVRGIYVQHHIKWLQRPTTDHDGQALGGARSRAEKEEAAAHTDVPDTAARRQEQT